jgi:hypothetical protein
MLSKPVANFLRPIASAGSKACSVGIKRESFVADSAFLRPSNEKKLTMPRLIDVQVLMERMTNTKITEIFGKTRIFTLGFKDLTLYTLHYSQNSAMRSSLLI